MELSSEYLRQTFSDYKSPLSLNFDVIVVPYCQGDTMNHYVYIVKVIVGNKDQSVKWTKEFSRPMNSKSWKKIQSKMLFWIRHVISDITLALPNKIVEKWEDSIAINKINSTPLPKLL